MTGIQFHRPVGPRADVSELEYVSALHQSQKILRVDGTVSANDISNYLRSRHGVQVEDTIVREQIVRDLCGSLEGDENEIDLCQIVSLLWIPYFKKSLKEEKDVGEPNAFDDEDDEDDDSPMNTIERVYDLMVTAAMSFEDYRVHKGGLALTPNMLQSILESFGEFDFPPQVIQGMIKAAGGDHRGVVLTPRRLQRALTFDIKLYDTQKDKQITTHYHDVVHRSKKKDTPQQEKATIVDVTQMEQQQATVLCAERFGELVVKQFYTAPNIDYVADTYRSPLWVILIWFSIITIYLSYLYNRNYEFNIPCANNEVQGYGCTVSLGVINWLTIFAQLSIFGIFFVYTSNFGNVTTPIATIEDKIKATLAIVCGMVVVSMASIFTFFKPDIDNAVITTNKNSFFNAGYYGALIAGCLILFTQAFRIVTVWLPRVGRVNTCSASIPKLESKTKQAATIKVDRMIESALLMHYIPRNNKSKYKNKTTTEDPVYKAAVASHNLVNRRKQQHNTNDSSAGGESNFALITSTNDALLHYRAMEDVDEVIGGVRWAWQRVINGAIFKEEGVWLHSRLLASNFCQLFISFFLIVVFYYLLIIANYYLTKSETLKQLEIKASVFAEQAIDGSFIMRRIDTITSDIINSINSDVESMYEEALVDFVSELSTTNFTELNASYYNDLLYDDWNETTAANETAADNNETLSGNETAFDFSFLSVFDSTKFFIFDSVSFFAKISRDYLDTNGIIYLEPFNNNIASNATVSLFSKIIPAQSIIDGVETIGFFLNTSDNSFFMNTSIGAVYFYSDEDNNVYFDGTYGAFFYSNETQKYFFDKNYFYDLLQPVKYWEVAFATSVGFCVASLNALATTLVFIPSTASTILKFRSGVFRSLKDPFFQAYRICPETTSALFGAAFWGIFFSSVATWGIVAIIAFLLVWSWTRPYAIIMSAQIVGIVITIAIKTIALMLVRAKIYSGFYRLKPAISNFLNLALECWQLALMVGYMTVRFITLMLIAAFYIGRLDTPMLAPGVGCIGNSQIDAHPINFRKDLLIHEAHHHPYIERLGVMYLMKLRNGTHFGTRAGASWRLLFVLTLMPWMRVYRARGKEQFNSGGDDSDNDYDTNIGSSVTEKKKKKSRNEMGLDLDILRRENRRLMKENEKMNKLLKSANLNMQR